MSKNASGTRKKILDAAQELILTHGYGGTSLSTILERTDVTKGAFFHHFDSKKDLAYEVIDRYAEADAATLEEFVARADKLSRDPLQQILILIGLYEESFEKEGAAPSGCLFASYSYQAGLFDERTNALVQEAFEHWQDVIVPKFEAAMAVHPPRIDVSAEDLSMMGLAIFEGSLILTRTFGRSDVPVAQLRQYRNYIELVFGIV
ncbi:MAG: TetR/AcrR family transcriptional regulator [Rhodothermales bacterium]|nr:TetR/AcrR family transcriptional regulator [Rhodothermales bacterium]